MNVNKHGKWIFMCLFFQAICLGKMAHNAATTDVVLEKTNDCQKLKRFEFCHYPGTGQIKNKVLYFFHGVFVDKKNWEKNNATRKIQHRWAQNTKGFPTVITVSYGPVWLLTSKNTRNLSGLLDEWTPETFYEMERRFQLDVQSRMIMGDSMGGHNALKLVNKMRNFFEKAVLICPAITMSQIGSNARDIFDFFPNFTGQFPLYYAASKLMSTYYDDLNWKQEGPLYFKDSFYTSLTKFRFQLLFSDIYGFTDTSLFWIRQAKTKGADIDYKISHGFHCDPDNFDYIADFLAELAP